MGLTELQKYDRKNLLVNANLGSGSSGCAKLLYDMELKDYVVGKFFK